ncbi:acyl-CoA dehydrogenase family protein [Rhodococcus qingshengii]|uniref:Pimeloyl-CoA dehydrogenase small subunit n=1 Tax=Rhodococcus qingshengii TaxID=334542 RepID=A0A2A5J1E6_RHOSG|nr:acyl-CoA dehydrogenase family protein [Rhodococcus qingshengii]PCK23039.1 pimeloyl-CoA dehydrogenase small subunit [Rhodococcus qingshengii]
MKLHHTDEQLAMQDMMRQYLAKEYSFEARGAIIASPAGYSPLHWKMLAELGVIGALFLESDGGLGGSGYDITTIFEPLGSALVVEPILSSAILAGGAIAEAREERRRRLLVDLAEGRTIAAWAHAEPASGYDLFRVSATACRQGDSWVLDGLKSEVDHAASATEFVVSARTSRGAEEEGISLFVVPSSTPGIEVRGYPTVDGSRTADVLFSGVVVPATALLGPADHAYPIIERAVGRGMLALCAEALGVMKTALGVTVEYLKARRQFGTPLAKFQALQHRLVDMWIEIQQADSAVINAASVFDSPDIRVRERALSAAKYTIGRVGNLVAEECIQMHGGIGMTDELPLSHYATRLISIDHQLGDEDFHLQRYIELGQEITA